jgi:hypothetical protein
MGPPTAAEAGVELVGPIKTNVRKAEEISAFPSTIVLAFHCRKSAQNKKSS